MPACPPARYAGAQQPAKSSASAAPQVPGDIPAVPPAPRRPRANWAAPAPALRGRRCKPPASSHPAKNQAAVRAAKTERIGEDASDGSAAVISDVVSGERWIDV